MNQDFLNNILQTNQITLPNDFYNYLVNISDNYIIDFNTACDYPIYYDDTRSFQKIVNFPKNTQFIPFFSDNLEITNLSYHFPDIPMNESDVAVSSSNGVIFWDVRKCMLLIGHGYNLGYYPYYIFLGQGVHFGSIWIDLDETHYNEFPEYVKTHQTFTQFLDQINILKLHHLWKSSDDDYIFYDSSDINDIIYHYYQTSNNENNMISTTYH